jgi:hypothetical protein
MTMQLELFAGPVESQSHERVPIDPLYRLFAQLSDTCRCGSSDAVIGEGKGSHRAAFFCGRCEGHRGWMANEAHAFVAEVVKKFGKTTKPIKIRRKQSEGEQR